MRRLWWILILAGWLGTSASPASAQNCVVVNGVTTCANTFRFSSPVFIVTSKQGPAVTITRGSLGANITDQAISSTATWLDSGTTYTHWKANVTDTASAAASLLMDLQVGGVSKFSVRKDGVAVAATRVCLSGITSSVPCLKANGVNLQARIGDDSALTAIQASRLQASSDISTTSGVVLVVFTAPTISSGFGSSPSIAANNGTAAFTVNVGTGGAATNGVIGLPTATTGWICSVNDLTAAAAHVATNTRQTASTTASVTVENQTTSTGAAIAWTASDVLNLACFAY